MASRATVGAVEILAMVDITPPPRDPWAFFPETTPEMWAPYRQHLDAEGKFQMQFGFFALRASGKTIVVDTGLGPGPAAQYGGARGMLMSQLQSHGIAPEDVDMVLITHLHGDHVGWNVTVESGQTRATFPRARYYLPKLDWDHFTQPKVLETAPTLKVNVVALEQLGVVELVQGDRGLTPEISMLATPGHTPGHQCVLINSQGERAVIVGDLFHSPAQAAESDWNVRADMDQPLARKTRHAVLDRLEQEGFTIAAGHMPVGSSIGKLARLNGRRYWQAL